MSEDRQEYRVSVGQSMKGPAARGEIVAVRL